jgi:hypothetical protein
MYRAFFIVVSCLDSKYMATEARKNIYEVKQENYSVFPWQFL